MQQSTDIWLKLTATQDSKAQISPEPNKYNTTTWNITKSQNLNRSTKIERIKAITLASLVPIGTNVPKARSTTTPPNFKQTVWRLPN
jgi:hypothetical protein